MEQVAVVSAWIIGVSILGLIAVWFLWQFTLHIGNLFYVWGKLIVWHRHRSKCTCDASDHERRGASRIRMPWRKRLTDRGKGIF